MSSTDVGLKLRFFEVFDRVGSVSVAAREVGANIATAYGWVRRAGGRSRAPLRRHPGRDEYERLRVQGVSRREAAKRVGVNVRSARDWDGGVRRTRHTRTYPDGRRVDYRTGVTTIVTVAPPLALLDKELHSRFLTLQDRETIADMRRAGQSLNAIGWALGRPASTVKREVDNHAGKDGVYRPYAAHRAWVASRARPKDRKLLQEGPLRNFVLDVALSTQAGPTLTGRVGPASG